MSAMQVPPGYKRTEVGVIPEDWDISQIIDIADVRTGPFGSALHEKDYVDNGTPIITVEHLGDFGVEADYHEIPKVSDEDKRRLAIYELEEDDIVFSRVGAIDRNALITIDEAGWLFSGRLLRVRPNPKRVHSTYLSYHFHTDEFKARVRRIAVGQTMASLNTQILESILVVLPPLPEQRAIAQVLSDADAWIAALDKLIAKKRAIKQAAMDELLTGRTRLPGFQKKPGTKRTEVGLIPEDWEVKQLGDVSEIIMGQSPQSEFYNYEGEGLPLIQGNADIANRKTIARTHTTQLTKLCLPGDTIMTVRAPVGKIGKAIFKACLGRGVCAIRHSGDYIYHYLVLMESKWDKTAKGSTFDSVDARDVRAMLVVMPDNLQERYAISHVLADMDAEIEALERQRAKAQAVKQGMMQELLTGRIRLV